MLFFSKVTQTIFGILLYYSFEAEGIGTIVPLYIYPQVINGVHNWQPLINSKLSHGSLDVWAIVNPNSGPGSIVDPNYVDAVNRLKAAGIHTLGYVSTNYTNRDANLIRDDIYKWKTFYSPNGIFFDEMAYEQCTSCPSYYSTLNAFAKSVNFTFTVGNPGTDTRPEYVNTVDTIMIYESSTGYPTETHYGGWHDLYPRFKWGIFPYNIASLNNNLVQDSKKHVGFIYATNDVLPNPWDTLPSYLNSLFDLLLNSKQARKRFILY